MLFLSLYRFSQAPVSIPEPPQNPSLICQCLWVGYDVFYFIFGVHIRGVPRPFRSRFGYVPFVYGFRCVISSP